MWLRIYALMLRQFYTYKRSPTRWMGLFFWPVMSLLVWGFVTRYLQTVALPRTVLFLLGAMIFWDVLFRSQQAITLSISEEVWVKNIINIFVTPVRTFELMLASCLVGLMRATLIAAILSGLAYVLYAFNLLAVGPALAWFYANLILFGWALGLLTAALTLRFGHSAQALIWGVPFLIQPLSAVFYPVAVLPDWLKPVAWALPSTYVFEGMRAILKDGQWDLSYLAASFALNLVYLAIGATYFGWMLGRIREKGYLSRLNMD